MPVTSTPNPFETKLTKLESFERDQLERDAVPIEQTRATDEQEEASSEHPTTPVEHLTVPVEGAVEPQVEPTQTPPTDSFIELTLLNSSSSPQPSQPLSQPQQQLPSMVEQSVRNAASGGVGFVSNASAVSALMKQWLFFGGVLVVGMVLVVVIGGMAQPSFDESYSESTGYSNSFEAATPLDADGANTGDLPAPASPHAAVEQYLGYLAAGDAASAAVMVPTGLSGDNGVFLAPEVLAGAVARISDIEVQEYPLEYQPGKYRVSYSYQLDGQSDSGVAKVFLVNGRWTLQKPILGTFTTSSPLPYFRIGNIEAPTNMDQYKIYPGVYNLETPMNGFFSGGVVPLLVTSINYPQADLKFTYSEKFSTGAEQEYRSVIDGCLAGLQSGIENNCSDFSLDDATKHKYKNIKNITARVIEYPTVLVSSDSLVVKLDETSGGRFHVEFDAVDTQAPKAAGVQHFSFDDDVANYFSFIPKVEGDQIVFE